LGQISFVEEIVSGKVSWKKRKIAEIIAEFQKGGTLIVSELSRLGRSMLECMEILSVAVEKGVRVYAVK
jgi:DNA invertase Pin-like site-specific DNA recombinase